MVLQNYVMLSPGIPAMLHFVDHRIETRTITDRGTGGPITRRTLVFDVDRLNGQPVVALYSTMADTHANQFAAYLPTKSYKDFDFTITANCEGFQRRYTVQAVPRRV